MTDRYYPPYNVDDEADIRQRGHDNEAIRQYVIPIHADGTEIVGNADGRGQNGASTSPYSFPLDAPTGGTPVYPMGSGITVGTGGISFLQRTSAAGPGASVGHTDMTVTPAEFHFPVINATFQMRQNGTPVSLNTHTHAFSQDGVLADFKTDTSSPSTTQSITFSVPSEWSTGYRVVGSAAFQSTNGEATRREMTLDLKFNGVTIGTTVQTTQEGIGRKNAFHCVGGATATATGSRTAQAVLTPGAGAVYTLDATYVTFQLVRL